MTKINVVFNFTLDVAAATTATDNGANLLFWGESQAKWIFNGTGGVSGYDAAMPAESFEWTGKDKVAGITPPDKGVWTILSTPTAENRFGPVFNTLVNTITFK